MAAKGEELGVAGGEMLGVAVDEELAEAMSSSADVGGASAAVGLGHTVSL